MRRDLKLEIKVEGFSHVSLHRFIVSFDVCESVWLIKIIDVGFDEHKTAKFKRNFSFLFSTTRETFFPPHTSKHHAARCDEKKNKRLKGVNKNYVITTIKTEFFSY